VPTVEGIMLSQTQKDKYRVFFHAWKLKTIKGDPESRRGMTKEGEEDVGNRRKRGEGQRG
jgi:hypothetical protein